MYYFRGPSLLIVAVMFAVVFWALAACIGLLVKRLAHGCERPRYVRDLSIGGAVVVVVFTAPVMLLLCTVAMVDLMWSEVVGAAVGVGLGLLATYGAVRVEHRFTGFGRRQRLGHCHSCGYDLRSAQGTRCPECAMPLDTSRVPETPDAAD